MDLYTFASMTASEMGYSIDQPTQERIISSLRVAGYTKIETPEDERIAQRIFIQQAKKLERLSKANRFRKASVTANPKDEFARLKELNDKGQCGKCKKPMTTAKLDDGEEVNFCDSCKVTLWK